MSENHFIDASSPSQGANGQARRSSSGAVSPAEKPGSSSAPQTSASAPEPKLFKFEALPEAVPPRRTSFRILRLVLSVGLLAFTANAVWSRQVQIMSRSGYINAPITTLHAPLDGLLYLESLEPGSAVQNLDVLGHIRNERNPELTSERQSLQSRLSLARSQAAGLAQRQSNRQAQIASFRTTAAEQRTLETSYFAAMLESHRSDVLAAQAVLEQTDRDRQRFETLLAEGAVALQSVEEARTSHSQQQQVVATQIAALRQDEARFEAAAQGLQLDGGRTPSYADMRLIELEREVSDLGQEQRQIDATILALETELQSTEAQLALQQTAPMTAPQTGVVWSIETYASSTGVPVLEGTPIVQIVNCEQLWVSAFVDERSANRLQVGQVADIQLRNGSQRQLQGQITAVRSGVGNTLSDVAIPPNEQARREVEVRLQLPEATFESYDFCGVGQSVAVTFRPGA